MILIFFVNDLADCKSITNSAKQSTRLRAGKVSRRIIVKLCQYAVTYEKSENNKEKKCIKPDWPRSAASILKDGIRANKDPTNNTEKTMILLKTKRRSLL